MALTDNEKQDIIFYTGWPAKVRIVGSTHFQKTLNDRMENLNDPTEAILRTILRKLDDIDKQLGDARCRFSTSQIGGGSNMIKINADEKRLLLQERRRCQKELSSTVDIPLQFSTGNISVCV